MPVYAKNYLKRLKYPIAIWGNGKRCRAAISGFWINWKGELLPCGMFHEPKIDLKINTFADAWKQLVKEFSVVPVCQKCEQCTKRNVCSVCFANCYTETGTMEGRPRYLCDVTDATIQLLLQFLTEEEQEEYRKLLEK